MIYVLAVLIGVVAGLRAMLAPTAVSWAASRAGLDVSGHWFAFLGYHWTPWVLTVAALGELFNDKLPKTPSRLVPPQLVVRLLTGGLSGAAVAGATGNWIAGLACGVFGALMGAFLGARARGALATALGRDITAALFEDVSAIAVAVVVVALAV